MTCPNHLIALAFPRPVMGVKPSVLGFLLTRPACNRGGEAVACRTPEELGMRNQLPPTFVTDSIRKNKGEIEGKE